MCDSDAVLQQVLDRHTQPNFTLAAVAGALLLNFSSVHLYLANHAWVLVAPILQYPHHFTMRCFAALEGGTQLEVNAVPIYAYDELPAAVRGGLVAEAALDAAVAGVLTLRARLGLFDPPTLVPYNNITNDTVLSAPHVALCRELAAQSAVLLQVR